MILNMKIISMKSESFQFLHWQSTQLTLQKVHKEIAKLSLNSNCPSYIAIESLQIIWTTAQFIWISFTISHWTFWSMKVVVGQLSMEEPEALRFHPKDPSLTTWGLSDDNVWIFGWTIPFKTRAILCSSSGSLHREMCATDMTVQGWRTQQTPGRHPSHLPNTERLHFHDHLSPQKWSAQDLSSQAECINVLIWRNSHWIKLWLKFMQFLHQYNSKLIMMRVYDIYIYSKVLCDLLWTVLKWGTD